jgi:hypothetical protein
VTTWHLFRVYIGVWIYIITLRDIFNIVGVCILLFLRDKEGPLLAREVVNISNDFFTGIGSMLTCFCMIRYLQFHAKFYILILALQAGLPDVLRFLIGVIPLFIGYVMAGTVWFGHYSKNVCYVLTVLQSSNLCYSLRALMIQLCLCSVH